MARALQIFLNADLRNGHEGLEILAKKEKIKISTLMPGEYVIFINSSKDKIKLYAAHNVIAYLKLPRGKIDLRTISLIPQAFNASGRIDYDELLKEVIEREFSKRNR